MKEEVESIEDKKKAIGWKSKRTELWGLNGVVKVKVIDIKAEKTVEKTFSNNKKEKE